MTMLVVCPKCGADNRVDAERASGSSPVCGKCKSDLNLAAPGHPLSSTDVSFERDVVRAGVPVLVDGQVIAGVGVGGRGGAVPEVGDHRDRVSEPDALEASRAPECLRDATLRTDTNFMLQPVGAGVQCFQPRFERSCTNS